MKLCPQCDFIYEDDQSVCDMDGKELVYEHTLSAFPEKTALEQSLSLTRARSRSFAVPALAGLGLVATLFLFYNVFTHRVSPPAINSVSGKATGAPTSPSTSSNPDHPISDESASPPALATSVASRSTPLAGQPVSANSHFATTGSTSNAEQPQQRGNSPGNLSGVAGTSHEGTGRPAAVAKTPSSLSVSSLPRVKALPRLKPLRRLEEQNNAKKTGTATLSQQPVSAKQKKDSRVGSFFKKTARILTKPFMR